MSKVAEASVEDVKLEDKTGIYVYKKQITDIQKRDGSVVKFSLSKIEQAVKKAFAETKEGEDRDSG